MIEFPKTTYVHRKMPKEAFYKHLSLPVKLKDEFVSDISRLYVEYILTKENLNLERESDIKEIIVMLIELKKNNYDKKTLEIIARQNPHKLLFILSYNDERQCALYQGKLYQTNWKQESEVKIAVEGFSLDDIWNHFVEQVALINEEAVPDSMNIAERLKRQEQIEVLNEQIKKMEALTWKERQPKKKFELYTRLKGYKKELEEIKNGKA
ncbi:MAG: DUF4391 domain-containing protein [Acidaminococcus sp.]|jgi:hypothetical protein|nr:DUF4391 domain-containing protein [Acidaminococcus sp.]MCI2101012.1 DUF4391 domain-containing protein [Acidaminococcus sp.]